MRKIIVTESQNKRIVEMLRESEDIETYQMPVDKKMNKPYCINPDKVLVVKKFLDKGDGKKTFGFAQKEIEGIGADGMPKITKIAIMKGKDGSPLRLMYQDQLKDLLIDRFQNMFLDKIERDMFMGQVLKDWFNGTIGVHGTLSTNALKESTVSSELVDERASETNTDPTEAQKEAGNYKMGHISIKGMRISIETPKGTERKGTDRDGKEWSRTMRNHYGYFTNTTGNGRDGDAVDVFLGPNVSSFDKVYVVDQKVDGEFDESKVMLGFDSKEAAKSAYLANYSSDWKGFWKITGVPIRVFKRWLYRDQKQRKPFFDYVTVKKHKVNEGLISEEEYNRVIKIFTAYNGLMARSICELLRQEGISADAKHNDVYITVEEDRNYPAYVDEVVEYARKLAVRYVNSVRDYMYQKYALREMVDIMPDDVYNNVRLNPAGEKRDSIEYDGWERVDGQGGKMNLRNVDTGELLSDKWFDWIGYLIDGLAIVRDKSLGYNIINDHGQIVLPEWHEDILEPNLGRGTGDFYTLIDGENEQRIDTRDLK